MIIVDRLTTKTKKSGSDDAILPDISCVIPEKRITTIIGKSGAGKTTLLRCFIGLEKDYLGTITVDGKTINVLSSQERAKGVGFVAQSFNLFPNMTALENCMQPMIVVLQQSKEEARAKAMEMLARLEMASFCDVYPNKLSGGQQQRVALARALCMGPKVILFDEPTSALDPANTANLATLLQSLCKQGITVVISSQDMTFVRMIVDRVYLMEAGQIVESFDIEKGKQLPPESKIYSFLSYKSNL
jgi:ABC-type polar amino acid transport system ATPase subunit